MPVIALDLPSELYWAGKKRFSLSAKFFALHTAAANARGRIGGAIRRGRDELWKHRIVIAETYAFYFSACVK